MLYHRGTLLKPIHEELLSLQSMFPPKRFHIPPPSDGWVLYYIDINIDINIDIDIDINKV